MRLLKVCRTLAFLPMLTLALGLLFAPPLPAADDGGFECTLETFKGSYIWTRDGAKVTEDKINHPFVTVGVLRPDGQGKIPYFTRLTKDARSRTTAEQVNDEAAGTSTWVGQNWGEAPGEKQAPPWRMEYSIEPSCRGMLTLWRPSGRVSGTWRMILANGGRDGVLTGAGGGVGVWTGILKRIDNSDQELEDRVVRMEELLGSVARVLGIVPKKD